MPTLDALIAKYKVPSSTIYRTSSKDKWKDQRNAFRDKLREEIDLQKTEELQGKLFKSDEITAEIAHEIFAKIKELLKKETQITPNGLASVSSSALTAQKLIKNRFLNDNMPDKGQFRTRCGSECTRCWKNKLKHANKLKKKQFPKKQITKYTQKI